MKAKDLMTKNVITLKKENTISEAVVKMINNDIGLIPVIDDEKKILGVITDRDILIRTIGKASTVDKTVEDVMTHTYVGVKEDEDIKTVLQVMGDYQLRRLLVVNEDDFLVGIITLGDIAINKQTNKILNECIRNIYMPNPQKDKPLRYLEVDDFPL